MNIWCALNSSLFCLIREISGRKNLGGGMLKAEAVDLKSFPIVFDFNKNYEINNLLNSLKRRDVLNPISEIDTEEHREIDNIVFDYFNLTEEERVYIIHKLKEVIFNRSQKAKT